MQFNDFTAAQVRIARPTDKFEAVIDFYVKGLGLKEIQQFKGNRGYEGVIIGLPDVNYHLEFTRYWKGQGITIEDPDGWRIVLMNRSYE